MVQTTATPASLAGLLEELIALQTGSALTNESVDLEAGLREATTQILELRALLRERCEATEALREEAAAAKTRLDESGLVLKNLAYEKDHYAKEAAACRAFKSEYPDEELELIPVDEFRRAWGDADEEQDPHRLMLNRLTHELAYRKETLQRLEGLRAQRDALAADVARARGELSSLEAELMRLHASGLALAERCGAALPPRTERGTEVGPGPAADTAQEIANLPVPLHTLHARLNTAAARRAAAAETPELRFEVRALPAGISLHARGAGGVPPRFAAEFRMAPQGDAVLAMAREPTTAAELAALRVGGTDDGAQVQPVESDDGSLLPWVQALAGLGPHVTVRAAGGSSTDGAGPMDTDGVLAEKESEEQGIDALGVLHAIAELCTADMEA